MSGCSYTCLAYPQAAHLDYLPSILQLERVVQGLVDSGWLEASGRRNRGVTVERDGEFKKVPVELATLHSALEQLAAPGTFWLEFHNNRDQGDPTPFEEDAEGVFRPAYCEDAYLFVSNTPLAVEDPYGTDRIPCLHCGANVLLERRDHSDPAVRRALLMPSLYAPERCPKCSTHLDLRKLSLNLTTVIDGPSPRAELGPFFRFGVWLLPVEKRYPEAECITLDSQILSLLQQECGVPFRSVGTLCCS